MNTRALAAGNRVMPAPSRRSVQKPETRAEELAFDKAEDAASVEKIRNAIEKTDGELKALDQATDGDPAIRSALEARKTHLIEQLKAGEEAIKAKEAAEKDSDDTSS